MIDQEPTLFPDLSVAENLSLREDGLLIGSSETDDAAASTRSLAENPDTAEWEAEAADFFAALPGTRPDQGAPQLTEVLHLEDQLAALDA